MTHDDIPMDGQQDPILPPSRFGAGYTVDERSAGAGAAPSFSAPPNFPPPVSNTGYISPPADYPYDNGLRYPQPVYPAPSPATAAGYPPVVGPTTPGYVRYPTGYGVDPLAPYGRDPVSGEPLSDKSAVAAGCLQLFLGGLGVGRFYIGSPAIGGIQLGLTIIGWVTLILFVGFFILAGVGIWVFIDALMMFTGSVRDGQGRKLR